MIWNKRLTPQFWTGLLQNVADTTTLAEIATVKEPGLKEAAWNKLIDIGPKSEDLVHVILDDDRRFSYGAWTMLVKIGPTKQDLKQLFEEGHCSYDWWKMFIALNPSKEDFLTLAHRPIEVRWLAAEKALGMNLSKEELNKFIYSSFTSGISKEHLLSLTHSELVLELKIHILQVIRDKKIY